MTSCDRTTTAHQRLVNVPAAVWEVITRWGTEQDAGKIKLCAPCTEEIVHSLLSMRYSTSYPDTINIRRLSDATS